MLTASIFVAAFAASIAGQSHKDCLRTMGDTLEISGEAASDVAAATVTACVSTEAAADQKSIYATSSTDDQMKIISMSRELSRDEVMLRVVRIRACRKTPNCKLDQIQ
jgi:hypothetical protein